jgi:hypothetical protein
MGASKLIDRLDHVRQSGAGRWIARCPAHEDRSPSLSVRELEDGRVLLHDFGGCEPGDVLAAVGLTMSNLFPERLLEHNYPASHSNIPARDLLVILDHELTVVVLILNDIVTGRTVNESQVQRLCLAAARIGKARDIANPAKWDRHAA